jgi:hypothetical protein
MTTIKTFVQKSNDFIKENNLSYSPELFKNILELIKNNKNNIIEEKLRVANFNNQSINENYDVLANICYSRK